MPALIRFIVENMLIGAAIGGGCAVSVFWQLGLFNSRLDMGGLALGMWGFSSVFALGYLATALVFMSESDA